MSYFVMDNCSEISKLVLKQNIKHKVSNFYDGAAVKIRSPRFHIFPNFTTTSELHAERNSAV